MPSPAHPFAVKVNAYLADRSTLNPACPKSGRVYMYTDDTGKDVYSPWTLEGLATQTVSRDQLRASMFGPNNLGESVASMFSSCRWLMHCTGAGGAAVASGAARGRQASGYALLLTVCIHTSQQCPGTL